MHMWFNRPHVQQFYSLRSWQEMEVLEKLKQMEQEIQKSSNPLWKGLDQFKNLE